MPSSYYRPGALRKVPFNDVSRQEHLKEHRFLDGYSTLVPRRPSSPGGAVNRLTVEKRATLPEVSLNQPVKFRPT